MNYKIVFFAILAFFIRFNECMIFSSPKQILTDEERSFLLKKFPPPTNIMNAIEKNKYKILKNISGKKRWTFKIDQIEGIYFKNDSTRLWNTEVMRTFIDKNNLDKLSVTKKYICEFAGRLLILSEEVVPHASNDIIMLDLETYKQVKKVYEELLYKDFGTQYDEKLINKNFVFDSDRKFVLIDTEGSSFAFSKKNSELSSRWNHFLLNMASEVIQEELKKEKEHISND